MREKREERRDERREKKEERREKREDFLQGNINIFDFLLFGVRRLLSRAQAGSTRLQIQGVTYVFKSVLDSRRRELESVSIQFWDDILGIAVLQLPRRTHIAVSVHNPNCSSSVSEKDISQ